MVNRASYKFAVNWIAGNDEPGEMDPQNIADSVTVMLIADLFQVSAAKVAEDVLKIREKEES